jgi:hypothetical protein
VNDALQAWIGTHGLSALAATFGFAATVYGALTKKQVATIEVNTNSRLSALIDSNEDLRKANLSMLGEISRLTGRIEGTETPIIHKETP